VTEMLHYQVRLGVPDFGKETSEIGLRATPTNGENWSTLRLVITI